jgi:UDP-2,4-diacetamido-2,4,6-trideoxy-beta-L-altropyranose hydrolase
MSKNLFVLVDASTEIGSGHIFRCLTLSRELKTLFSKIILLTSDESRPILKNIELNDIQTIHIPSFKNLKLEDYTQEFDKIKKILLDYSEDKNFLLIDHYDIDSKFELMLKNLFFKILVIDDLADRKHSCDMLIDHGYYKNLRNRYNKFVSKNTIKLLGPKYMIIRSEFRKINKKNFKENHNFKKILITFGSVDVTNECEKALDALCLLTENKFEINVIAGSYNKNFSYLLKKYEKYDNINIVQHVNDIEILMSNSDLCIGAGGTTNLERCCVGIPSIVTIVADNQKEGINFLSESDHVINLGLAKDVTTKTYLNALKNLDSKLLSKMSQNNQKLVDGLGCNRIKNEISKLIHSA